MKSFVLFVCGTLLFGALALGIGFWVWGEDSLLQGGVAFGLTFVPAAITLAWVVSSYRAAPHLQLLASLAGSGVRMAVALGGGLLLTTEQPQTFHTAFWFWLVLFYLALLGFEIALVVRQQPKLNGSPQQ
jgi:hypothetical protein